MKNFKEIILADIGNSRTKFLCDSKIISIHNKIEDIAKILKKYTISQFIYTSVNPKFEKQICDYLTTRKINFLNAKEIIENNNIINFSKVSGMGQDRKLGLLGAASYTKLPVITIDCGTAVTVNVADKSGICLGGAIFPDIELQLRALHEFTASLPKINAKNYFHIGNTTENAINFGVLASVSGGIIKILDTIIKVNFNGFEPEIFITGGLSEIILPILISDFTNIKSMPNLVLSGLAYIISPDHG